MLKKITTDNHTFLVEEKNVEGNEDAIYGKSLLLSIYVGYNKKMKTKSGNYYFNNQNLRIALKQQVNSIEEPTKKEEEFYNLLKEKKEISYSNSLIQKYGITKYIRYYFVKEKNKNDEKQQEMYPSCKVYYDHKILE